MNTRQILCFLQLAETKSFSAVAEKMFLSISTVSYQLRHFEEELGFPLFFRDQHSVTLTPAGAAYAEELRKIYDMHQDAIERAAQIYRESQTLTVGFTPEVILNCYPALLLNFQKCCPQIHLDSVPVNISSGCDPLRFKTVDMMFTYDCWVKNNPDYEFISLKQSQFYCVVNHEDPLAVKSEIEPQDLSGKTIIITTHNDQWIRDIVQEIDQCTENVNYLEIEYCNFAIGFVKANAGVSIFPYKTIPGEKNDVLFIPFNRRRKITLVLAWRKGELNEVGKAFIQLCQTKMKTIQF